MTRYNGNTVPVYPNDEMILILKGSETKWKQTGFPNLILVKSLDKFKVGVPHIRTKKTFL